MDGRLRAVPAEDYDQVVRLTQLRVRHPDVIISGADSVRWKAQIPGQEPVTRLALKDLLDELDGLLGPL